MKKIFLFLTVLLLLSVTGNTKPIDPNVFYSKSAGDLQLLSTWGNNPDGTGPQPSFFSSGKTFTLANRGSVYTMTADWSPGGTLVSPSGSELRLNGFTLTIGDRLSGTGTLTGSVLSGLVVPAQEVLFTWLLPLAGKP